MTSGRWGKRSLVELRRHPAVRMEIATVGGCQTATLGVRISQTPWYNQRMALAPPILSIYDPPEGAEGSIDPLSLQATYECLAERIYPLLTVRMKRPRFLTAISVLARFCEGLEDEVASDDFTPAWLVGYWYVVEALVRRRESIPEKRRRGLPGTMKVEHALRSGHPISATAYLKTPRVFRFTGVYKTLGDGLELLTGDVTLDDGGLELPGVWEREQRLRGFCDGGDGPGAELRDELRRAVETGLKRGFTDRHHGHGHERAP